MELLARMFGMVRSSARIDSHPADRIARGALRRGKWRLRVIVMSVPHGVGSFLEPSFKRLAQRLRAPIV
jgi:hypothetical protein